ncbi:hypothetical protein VDG1235_242 [Verrucomicrobiia bacterium DG1235]|nr:hypothetical protein VDG1235_242 [Verrucomicrobiae bacterium DG1235]
MNEKEMKAFVDRLRASNEPIGIDENLSDEEQQLAAIWDDLGELKEPEAVDNGLVSDFQDKLDAYRLGWDAALDKEGVGEASSERRRSPFWSVVSYGLVAGAAAVFALAGFVAHSYMERTDTLQAELRATQETLALSLLDESSASKRLAGLATVSKISEPSEQLRKSVVHAFDTDANINVRLAAVAALQALPREEALAVLLERMEKEASPIVQLEILRQVLNLVEEGSQDELVERLEAMPMEPRVKTFWDANNQRI